jgi:hypothetical protein
VWDVIKLKIRKKVLWRLVWVIWWVLLVNELEDIVENLNEEDVYYCLWKWDYKERNELYQKYKSGKVMISSVWGWKGSYMYYCGRVFVEAISYWAWVAGWYVWSAVWSKKLSNIWKAGSKVKRGEYEVYNRNMILRHMEEIKDGWDLIKVAEMVEYKDKAIKWWAIFVKWDKSWAEELMERFERMWWRKEEIEPGEIYLYESPDRRWKINYRTISSSKDRVEKAGYKVEVTLDVIDEVKKKNKEKPYEKEIKFISLK